jgi:uncharacterized protein YbjT (DUF2867 family)
MAENGTTLVVGATGSLGGLICQRLTAEGAHLRAVVRPTSDPERVAALRALGAELVEADLKEPATLPAVCAEVSAIVSTAEAVGRQPEDTFDRVDRDGQLVLVDAAEAAGVGHFVFVSHSTNVLRVDTPFERAKLAVEQRLQQGGIDYTILRATFFTEFWLGPAGGFDYVSRQVTVYGDGTNPISFVSQDDVAEFAVRSLDTPAARNTVLELGGPEPVSPLAAIEFFEQLTDDAFERSFVPLSELEAQMAAAADPMQESFAGLMIAYARGDAIDMGPTLERVPVELTSVFDYARRAVAAAAPG